MSDEFVVHQKATTGRTLQRNTVSLMKAGVLGMTGDVYEKLGSPIRIEYLFNRERSILAIRSAKSVQNGYKVRQPRKSGYAQASIVSVCKEYGIDLSRSTKHTPWVNDGGLLCIDVSGLIT